MDPRAAKLAKIIVEHSVKVTKGSNVIIDASDFAAQDLIHECYKLCLEKGANVYLDICGTNYEIGRADVGGFMKTLLKTASDKQLTTPREIMEAKINWAQKFIRIVTIHNKNFLANIDPEKITLWSRTYYPTFDKMINKDWLLTYFPTHGMAQNAKMSLEDFTDFYYKASTIDYKKQGAKIKKLQDVLDKGERVHIKAKDTDLTVGIKGRLAAGAESGTHNIPDGECFVGPEEDVTEGYITFEYPQNRDGNEVTNIRFEYKKGSIVDFRADSGKKFLQKVLDDHPGNRRLGELGIGMNPMIKDYIKDILFDEKIMGTVHFAIGKAYESERGGGKNQGTTHWDMIKDLRHKGSLVTVDGAPIIANGKLLV